MTLTEALKAAEDLMEQVSTAGEQNWQRMGDAKKLVRAVRQDIERQEKETAEQAAAVQKELERIKKEEAANGSGDDADQKRDPEDDAGAV